MTGLGGGGVRDRSTGRPIESVNSHNAPYPQIRVDIYACMQALKGIGKWLVTVSAPGVHTQTPSPVQLTAWDRFLIDDDWYFPAPPPMTERSTAPRPVSVPESFASAE